jgi:hypothetical protein
MMIWAAFVQTALVAQSPAAVPQLAPSQIAGPQPLVPPTPPATPRNQAAPEDISTMLMRSVFMIEGPSVKEPKELSFGAGMVIGKLIRDDRANYVFVTAAHVLQDIDGDFATITLRTRNYDGTFKPQKVRFRIRDGGRSRYIVDGVQDAAAAFISLPIGVDVDLLPTSLLLTDERITSLELHPGDELYTLGFPLYLDIGGFAVLRSGILASYPLTPMEKVKEFYFNFRVFKGNSGGPVFFDFANRNYMSRGTVVGREWGIVGLVSSEVSSTLTGEDTPLDVSRIVPALYVRELIDRLPQVPVLGRSFEPQ